MPAHRSFSVGGSIARRPSPGRNCRRARRATAGPVVIAILTPRSQEPPMDFNAKRQRPKDAKAITIAQYPCANDRTCACWTQLFLLRSLSVLLFKVSGCGFSPCAFAPWRLGVFTFASKSPGPKCLYRVPFQLLPERHCDPLRIQKILKNPNDYCCLRPIATSCRPSRKNSPPANLSRQRLGGGASLQAVLPSNLSQPALFSSLSSFPQRRALPPNRVGKNESTNTPPASFHFWPLPAYAPVYQPVVLSAEVQSTAIAARASFQLFPSIFTSFNSISPLHRLDQNTQPIAPKLLATQSNGAAISKTSQLLTLFFILPLFYERQASF